MEEALSKYIKSKGFETLITNKYLNTATYNTFDNIVSLSNTRSVVSASIGFNVFDVKSVAYITNFFEFLYIFDDCYKDIPLNMLVCINYKNVPEHLSLNILDNYKIKYYKVKSVKNLSVLDELMQNVVKKKGSGLLVIGEGNND